LVYQHPSSAEALQLTIHVSQYLSPLLRVTFSFANLPPIKKVTSSDHRTFGHSKYQKSPDNLSRYEVGFLASGALVIALLIQVLL
jgi:hypothetical protein